MGRTIGIDLGTTNSCVAVLEGGQPTVIPNAEGGRTTPSVVAWARDAEVLAGASARRQAVTNPTRTVGSIKRFMGRKLSEVSDEQQIVPYTVIAGDNDAARVALDDDRVLAPEEISALVLAKLKADAENYLGAEITDAVITVPAYFNDAQRQATKDAGAIAGLNVKRLVNEPTAAALAYGLGDFDEQTVLVFDLGGGTFDVSVLEIADGVFDVLATAGDNQLGGDDFDKVIVDHLAVAFAEQEGIDLRTDPLALQRLYEAAEKAKVELSAAQRTQINLPFITADAAGPKHLQLDLTRGDLTAMVSELLDRLLPPACQAMTAAKLTGPDGQPDFRRVDHVLLVGGMTRMPAVRERVSDLTGTQAHHGINPDEAVAMGAAVQAGVLEGEVTDVLLLDVTPLSLGIETKGGITARLIEANTTIPTKVTEVFTTAEDNQHSVEIHVVQGEREMARDNRTLGRVQLHGIPPALANVPQIEVSFELSADGILNVTAQDLATGDQRELRIESSTGLTAEEVDRMRREAAENAEADRAERQAAELRVSVEALRDQAQRNLARHGDTLSVEDASALAAAIDDVDAALDSAADEVALREAAGRLGLAIRAFTDALAEDDDRDDDLDEVIAAVDVD